jgi:mono/diheme cytochrome c family protein
VNTTVTTFDGHGDQRVVVHAGGGHGGGPTLIAGLPADTIMAVAAAGRNDMSPFGRVYSDADLRDVATYITDVLAK